LDLIAPSLCRSEPARDEIKDAAGYQVPRVIVDDHREQTERRPAAPTGSACTLAKPGATSEVGAICMLIGRDRSHGAIVRFRGAEQTETLSATQAFTTRKTP